MHSDSMGGHQAISRALERIKMAKHAGRYHPVHTKMRSVPKGKDLKLKLKIT
jgi:hypothetical protein